MAVKWFLPEIHGDSALRLLDALVSLPLQVRACQPLMPLSFEVAYRTQRTVYDSLYLAVALLHECPMVTADRKLHEALKKGGFAGHLLWVADVP